VTDIYQSGEYVANNPTYDVEDSPWKAGLIVRMLEKHGIVPQSVCEVGCGAGEVLVALQDLLPDATRFTGFDVSPFAYERCRPHENERLDFRCGDFLSIDTERFDLVNCLDVFEHVEDYLGFLRNLRSRAEWKLFHIPLDMWVGSVLFSFPILNVRRSVGHLHYFSKETALLSLEHAGYEIVDWSYTAGSIERGRGPVNALFNVPRRLFYPIHADLTVRLFGGYSLLVLAR